MSGYYFELKPHRLNNELLFTVRKRFESSLRFGIICKTLTNQSPPKGPEGLSSQDDKSALVISWSQYLTPSLDWTRAKTLTSILISKNLRKQ